MTKNWHRKSFNISSPNFCLCFSWWWYLLTSKEFEGFTNSHAPHNCNSYSNSSLVNSFRLGCHQSTDSALPSCSSHPSKCCSDIDSSRSWNLGATFAILARYQSTLAITAYNQRWCWRSAMWTCFICSFWSLATCLCQMFPITVLMEDFPGGLCSLATSHRTRWAVESSEFGTHCKTSRVYLWIFISGAENTWV